MNGGILPASHSIRVIPCNPGIRSHMQTGWKSASLHGAGWNSDPVIRESQQKSHIAPARRDLGMVGSRSAGAGSRWTHGRTGRGREDPRQRRFLPASGRRAARSSGARQ